MTDFFHKYIRKENHNYIPTIKYKTNFTNCISLAFERRGFVKTQYDDWDIIWSEKDNIHDLYEKRVQPHQKINHFKHYFELCRKDLLIKNLKKHRKLLEREGKLEQAQTYNYYPQTYVLPAEYVIFADEFKRNQNEAKNVWIMKPAGKSQGKGIFLFNKISQISHWENHSAESYIVQKYISEPLLLGGKKFDIRIYVLVTSYSPLTVYLYRSGFARFTHCRYEESKIQNSEIHLTNVAIQKHAEGYDENIGGKWDLDKLKKFLMSKYSIEPINLSFLKIQELVVKTLQALQKVMASDKQNSFQLYGFDILLDSKLQPWLIEVNGSPSMTANTQNDQKLKLGLLDDTLTVIDMEKFLSSTEQQVGGFDLVHKGTIQQKKTNNHVSLLQKVSFLGTFNNRNENLNKIAKTNSVKLNLQYSSKRQINERKAITQNNSHENTQGAIIVKRNILSRKTVKSNAKQFVIKQKYKRDQNQF